MPDARKIKTVIFPVAGLGTRLLPLSKSVPKELMPVYNKPLIQYAIDEAKKAGFEKFIFVSSPDKPSLNHYIHADEKLHEYLRIQGKLEMSDMLKNCELEKKNSIICMQNEPLGLGHAVYTAHPHIGDDEIFAVIAPDDLILASIPAIGQLKQAYERHGGILAAVEKIDKKNANKYGILRLSPDDNDADGAEKTSIKAIDLVEKPSPEKAPSCYAIITRYILDGRIMPILKNLPAGAGGEIQLTDAMRGLMQDTDFHGVLLEGRRFDCGSYQGLYEANHHVALQENANNDNKE